MTEQAEPKLLVLETSGRVGQVALAEGVQFRGCRRLDEARRHARDLAPAMKDLLAAQGWQPRDLNAVIVSRGPGSYTGLRVGIISAKTLAYALGCAVIGVDTFSALVVQAPSECDPVDVFADAQQGRVYVQRFARSDGRPLTALTIVDFSTWLSRWQADSWLTGPGLHLHSGQVPEPSRLLDPVRWDPQVPSLVEIGLARYLRGERDDLWTLEPLYARPSAAEEKWSQR